MRKYVKKITGKNKKVFKKRTARLSAVPVSIKQYVNKSINREVETKCQSFTEQTSLLPFATNTLRTLDFNSVLNLISAGTGEGNRIGTRVKVVNLQIKGWLSVGTTFSYDPIVVRMFVGRLKASITTPNAGAQYASLFQNGSGVSAPQNNYFDMLRVVNRNVFTVHAQKTFKLGKAGDLGSQTTNNDFKLLIPFNINVNKHINTLIFNDNALASTNFGCFVWFTVSNADGTATNPLMPPLVNLCYDMEVKYKDS